MSLKRPSPETAVFRCARRLRYHLSRLFGNRLQNSQRLSFVTVNGQRFKRLIMHDASLAAELERNLEAFRSSPHFPLVAIRYERELWLEYVEGSGITQIDETVVEKIAEFYAAVYRQNPRPIQTSEAVCLYRLQRDLDVLLHVGVLTDAVHRDLQAAAERLTPEQIWIGFDYIDAVLKNFIVTQPGNVVCGIDVDSLRAEQIIGTGVANALVRWLGPFQEQFFRTLFQQDVPDFRPYLPFVELCYLAAWTKMYFFEKKKKRIDPRLFERFRVLV